MQTRDHVTAPFPGDLAAALARDLSPSEAVRLARRTRSIDGWLSPGAVYLFALVDWIQKRERVEGNLFEIGVHHGKSALVLGAMRRPGERLGVCDIFGAQSLNVSASGKGNRLTFTGNFRKAFPDDSFLMIYEKLSSGLTPDEVTRCRFLHVDGGHSTAEALADLELSLQCLAPGGVIAVDDAFNAAWPGVTEAVFQILARHPTIAPLVVGFNKMLLVEQAWHARYASVFEHRNEYRRYIPRQPYSMKTVELFAMPTYVFYVHSSRSEGSLATRLHRVGMEYPKLKAGPAAALWRGFRGIGRRLLTSR